MALIYAADSEDVAAIVTWAAIGSVHRWPPETVARWRREGKIDVTNARTGEILPVYTDLLDDLDQNGKRRLDLLAAARRLQTPWLIVHGDTDETVPVADAHCFFEAASDDTKLQIVRGGSHTLGSRQPWAGSTAELELAMGETVAWFSRYLI